jgi:hypothetical protein
MGTKQQHIPIFQSPEEINQQQHIPEPYITVDVGFK